MGYQRTKYIGVNISKQSEDDPTSVINGVNETDWLDTQHQVRVEIANRIKEGDRWMVLQTVCLIEGEAPRPPIKITEYK